MRTVEGRRAERRRGPVCTGIVMVVLTVLGMVIVPLPAQAATAATGVDLCAQVGQRAGFRDDSLVTAVAVALAESSCIPSATNSNTNGSIDRGLWQINSIHTQYSITCVFDPQCNAGAAWEISAHGTNWQPWTTYNNGDYRAHLEQARAAVTRLATPPPTATGLTFSIRYTPTAGGANLRMGYGPAGPQTAVAGNWDGRGGDEIGVTWTTAGGRMWSLASGLASGGAAERYRFGWGSPSTACVPIAGNWDGVGSATVGQTCADATTHLWKWSFDPVNGGGGSIGNFEFGPTNCTPVTGDWDGNGTTNVGVSCRLSSGMLWAQTTADPDAAGHWPARPSPSAQFGWGPASTGCRPVTGNWDGKRIQRAGHWVDADTVGVTCPYGIGVKWYLSPTNRGYGPVAAFTYGNSQSTQLTGRWTTTGMTGIADVGHAAPPATTLRTRIVDLAKQQVGHSCSPYTDARGVSACENFWCSVFLGWVWRHAGVSPVPDTWVATTVASWGQQHGLFTPRPAGGVGNPQPGDAVVFGAPGSGPGGHVGIVVAVHADGTLDTVNGDYGGGAAASNHVLADHIDPRTATSGSGVLISGYVSPPGA